MKSFVSRVTANGIEHGIIGRFPNQVRTDGFEHMEKGLKEKCLKEQKNNATIVKALYKSKEEGGILEMPYTLGGGFPIEQWRFIDNYIYEIPKGLYRKVNGTELVHRKLEEDAQDLKQATFNGVMGVGALSVDDKMVGKSRPHSFFILGSED